MRVNGINGLYPLFAKGHDPLIPKWRHTAWGARCRASNRKPNDCCPIVCSIKYKILLHNIPQWTQNIFITFIQCWVNVEDVGPTLYKCYKNVLCLGYRVVIPWNVKYLLFICINNGSIQNIIISCVGNVGNLNELRTYSCYFKKIHSPLCGVCRFKPLSSKMYIFTRLILCPATANYSYLFNFKPKISGSIYS